MRRLARGEGHLPEGEGWLSAAEVARAARMRYTKRRTEYLVARWTAKEAVAQALQLDGWTSGPLAARARIEVRHHVTGAPELYVDGRPHDLGISLTDRAGWAVCLGGGPGGLGAAVGPDDGGRHLLRLVAPVRPVRARRGHLGPHGSAGRSGGAARARRRDPGPHLAGAAVPSGGRAGARGARTLTRLAARRGLTGGRVAGGAARRPARAGVPGLGRQRPGARGRRWCGGRRRRRRRGCRPGRRRAGGLPTPRGGRRGLPHRCPGVWR
jgi:hypothetical protein